MVLKLNAFCCVLTRSFSLLIYLLTIWIHSKTLYAEFSFSSSRVFHALHSNCILNIKYVCGFVTSSCILFRTHKLLDGGNLSCYTWLGQVSWSCCPCVGCHLLETLVLDFSNCAQHYLWQLSSTLSHQYMGISIVDLIIKFNLMHSFCIR